MNTALIVLGMIVLVAALYVLFSTLLGGGILLACVGVVIVAIPYILCIRLSERLERTEHELQELSRKLNIHLKEKKEHHGED